jgi:hypothetical protein
MIFCDSSAKGDFGTPERGVLGVNWGLVSGLTSITGALFI